MVDDHPVVLAGLKALVGAELDFTVIGEARDGRTALRMAMQLAPDVVVLDISLPEMNGIELTAALRSERPDCRILVLRSEERRVGKECRCRRSAYHSQQNSLVRYM